jgi:hypothetical protein
MSDVLLTTVCRPFGGNGEGDSVGAELFHAQVTRSQGIFSYRQVIRCWGLDYIAENIEAPTSGTNARICSKRASRPIPCNSIRTESGTQSRGQAIFRGYCAGVRISYLKEEAGMLGHASPIFLDMDDREPRAVSTAKAFSQGISCLIWQPACHMRARAKGWIRLILLF